MPEFLETFFPSVAAAQRAAAEKGKANVWCTFEDHALSLFTSSIFLAGIFSTLVAASISRCAVLACGWAERVSTPHRNRPTDPKNPPVPQSQAQPQADAAARRRLLPGRRGAVLRRGAPRHAHLRPHHAVSLSGLL
jgi:hypothetical protein